jgi:hypothetical protein
VSRWSLLGLALNVLGLAALVLPFVAPLDGEGESYVGDGVSGVLSCT